MIIRWTDSAVRDFTNICDYIDQHRSGAAARRVALSIHRRIDLLAEFPEHGRTGRKLDTRELVFTGLPYLAVYRIYKDAVEIVRILHGAQELPGQIDLRAALCERTPTMHNPWKDLPLNPPYVLRADLQAITTFNSVRQPNRRIEIEVGSIPEPFIGNSQSAKVVLLNGNPGHDVRDGDAHKDQDFGKALRLNLLHEKQDYPFFPLNPMFSRTPCASWWYRHLRELFDVGGLTRLEVAQRLCVIEWFPYHSLNGKNLPQNYVVASQIYSFEIATQALKADKLIVGMRAKPRWTGVGPHFGNIPYLKNPQNPTVSRKNAGESLFWQIVNALR
jgi:toxin ParE1/3/4